MYKLFLLLSSCIILSGCAGQMKGVTIGFGYVGYENEKTAVALRKVDDVDTGTIHLRANARAKTGKIPAFEAMITQVSDSESQLDVYIKNNN